MGSTTANKALRYACPRGMGGEGWSGEGGSRRSRHWKRWGVKNGEEVPLEPTVESGGASWAPPGSPGRSHSRKRISMLSKRHRMPLVEMFVVNWRRCLLIEKHNIWSSRGRGDHPLYGSASDYSQLSESCYTNKARTVAGL